MKDKQFIDKSPLWVLLVKEYRNAIFLLIIFGLFFTFINQHNLIANLDLNAYRAVVIFIFAIILWVSNLIPLSVTSLMIMGVLASYNVLDTKSIYSFFGNSSVFFIIGAFIISAGVRLSGLSKRTAYYILSRFGDTPSKLIITVFLLGAGLSHIMPEHAVAALMLPILIDICHAANIKKGSDFGKYLFLSMAWGVIVGGVVTFLGGARNPLAIGILNEMTGKNIGFVQWIIASAPPVYILGFLIIIYFKIKIKDSENLKSIETADVFLVYKLQRLEKINFREVKAGIILLVTIFLWVFYNERIGIANIALICAALYFIFNVLTWEEANREINWGVIFMYGGAIALGKALNEVGVLSWFVETYLSQVDINPYLMLVIFSFFSLMLTEAITNAAVIVVLLPVVIELTSKIGVSNEIAVLSVAIPSGLAYMLPMSTPAVSMIIASGYVRAKDVAKSGIILNILSWLLVVAAMLTYWKILYR